MKESEIKKLNILINEGLASGVSKQNPKELFKLLLKT